LSGISFVFPEFALPCMVIGAMGEMFLGVLNASAEPQITSPNVILDDAALDPVFDASSTSGGYASGLPTKLVDAVEGAFSRASDYYLNVANVYNSYNSLQGAFPPTSPTRLDINKLLSVSNATQLAPFFASKRWSDGPPDSWSLFSIAEAGLENILSQLPTLDASIHRPLKYTKYPNFGRHSFTYESKDLTLAITYDAGRDASWHYFYLLNAHSLTASGVKEGDDAFQHLADLFELANGGNAGLDNGVFVPGERTSMDIEPRFELVEVLAGPPHPFPKVFFNDNALSHIQGVLQNRGSPLSARFGRDFIAADRPDLHTAIQRLLSDRSSDYFIILEPQYLSQTAANTFVPITSGTHWRVDGLWMDGEDVEYSVPSHKYISSGVLTNCKLDEGNALDPMWMYTIHPWN